MHNHIKWFSGDDDDHGGHDGGHDVHDDDGHDVHDDGGHDDGDGRDAHDGDDHDDGDGHDGHGDDDHDGHDDDVSRLQEQPDLQMTSGTCLQSK